MYNRQCILTLNKGVEVNTSTQDFLDVKFHVKYSVNQVYGGANVAVCGLSKSNVNELMKNFCDGVTFQRDNKTEVTLKAGYTGGDGAVSKEIYRGTAWDAVLKGGQDMWLEMNCLTQYEQTVQTDVVVINKPMKFEDACKKICRELMGIECKWAVTDAEANKIPVSHWSSDVMKERTMPEDIAQEIEKLGRGMVKCWVEDGLANTPVVVADKKSSDKGWKKVQSICELNELKFSCTGEGSYDSLVYGIPQLTVNGVNLDIQLCPTIRRGNIFTVESNIIPNVKGLSYAVLAYEHIGHFRGQDWKTHIEAISLNQEAYLQ